MVISKAFWSITNWIDDNEYEGDDKTGYRLFSLPDIIVREVGFYFNELWKKEPRATNEKNMLRIVITGTINDQVINMATATTAQLPEIQRQQMMINRALYDQINVNDRYDIIGPDGDGYVAPILPENAPIPETHYQELFGGYAIAPMQQEQQRRGRQRHQRVDAARPAPTHGMTLRQRQQAH